MSAMNIEYRILNIGLGIGTNSLYSTFNSQHSKATERSV